MTRPLLVKESAAGLSKRGGGFWFGEAATGSGS